MDQLPRTTRLSRIFNWASFLILAACFVLIGIDRATTQAAQLSPWRPVTITMYEWAIVGSGFVLLAGGFNIIWTHFRRIVQGGSEWVLSLLMLVVMLTVVTTGLLDSAGTTGILIEWIFEYVLSPLQASLFALLGLFLAAAAYRYLRLGQSGGGWMLAGALAMFIMQLPLIQGFLNRATLDIPMLGQTELTLRWLLEWPVLGVMRGAVLGAALSMVVVAVRFLLRYRA